MRWYEQDLGVRSPKRRRIEQPPPDESEKKSYQKQIRQLEAELEEIDKSDRLPDDFLLEGLEGEDRIRFAEALRKRREQAEELQKAMEFEISVSPEHQYYVDKFKSSLLKASMDGIDTISDESRRDIWKWYTRCRQRVPSLIAALPDTALEFLSASQAEVTQANPDRLQHLRLIVEDILRVGREVKPEQKLVQIEAMFVAGEKQQALTMWEIQYKYDGGGDASSLELGIRMYAHAGKIGEAIEVAKVLFRRHPEADARIVWPIIRECNLSGRPESAQQAWSLYVLLQDRLGSRMTMKDYDAISQSFLECGQADMALAVFKDMMICRDPAMDTSSTIMKRALGRVDEFWALSKGADQLNQISLAALIGLPRKLQNKYFYASWVAKLIGMGKLDNAEKVTELMYERGVPPDAKHVNGLIGAWMRLDSVEAHSRAEQMAWAMIQARMDFVWRRRMRKAAIPLDRNSVYETEKGVRIPTFISRPVPPATLETFSILVPFYLQRNMSANVRYLAAQLQACEIRMDAYFMNHLIYDTLAVEGPKSAWDRYRSLSNPGGALPYQVKEDLNTFVALWDCAKASLKRSDNDKDGFPSPRVLFTYMSEWTSVMSKRDRRKCAADFEPELYSQIIHCLSATRDLPGILVTMQALEAFYGALPTEDIARTVILQIAKLESNSAAARGPVHVQTRKDRRAGRVRGRETGLAVVSAVLQRIDAKRRERESARTSKSYPQDGEEGERRSRESLLSLSELLKYFIDKHASNGENVENLIRDAAEEMGVAKTLVGATLEEVHRDNYRRP